jgi:PAS domain S-box-containing protein
MDNGKTKILLIDEDRAEGEAIKALLAAMPGHEFALQQVRSLAEGLDLLTSRRFDCALVALRLPDCRGADAVRAVRDRDRALAIVALADAGEEDLALDLLRGEIQDYLIKGETRSHLLARTVRKAMQRKRISDELSESEERLRFASDAAHIGTWHWDLLRDDLTWSDRCKELFGFPRDYEMSYQSFLDAIHPEDRDRIDAAVQHSMRDKCEYAVEMRVVHVDGTVHWVMSKGRAFYDDQGKPVRMHGIAMDVTARKQAEQERERVLLQLDSVLESLNEGVAIADLEGNLVRMNAAARAVNAFEGESEGLQQLQTLYRSFELTRLDGSSIPVEEWPLARAVRGEQVKDLEVRVRRRDTGRSRILAYNATPVVDRSGEIILGVTTMRDVTDQKQAVEALRVSEAKFATIFSAAPSLIVITTLDDGRILDINRSALETLGYERDEMIGRTVQELQIWENAQDRERILQQLKERGSLRGLETRFKGRNGRAIVAHLSAEVLDIDGTPCILSIVGDITKRKQAEDALLRVKEEWERTFDSVPDFIAIMDSNNRVVRVNRALAERLGLKPEQCVGLPCYTAFHGTDTPPDFCPHVRGLLAGKSVVEMYESHLSGHFLVSNTPLLGPDGKQCGLVHVARDISDRKAAEEKIERLNEQLAARAAELEAANRDLEAFNYSVAHDLRQPLNIIYGYCQAVHMLCSDKLDRECRLYLQDSFRVVERMNAMIDTLLNFSRLGRVELRRERVDLSAIARGVALDLRQSQPERKASFRIADGIVADGDAALLRTVLENLLGNAWKYTAADQEAVIEFGATELEGESVCYVRDNGSGFDMAHADKLFVPFQRLPNSDSRSGFGIGLATVERIVQRHGGKVWAEAESGRGATFYFTLGAGGSRDGVSGEAASGSGD